MKYLINCFKKYEWLLAVILMLGAVIIAQWSLLTASNNLYPQTVDGMGHLTKIRYMADCIRDGFWPSWFPYWYNGATSIQYYPPLSYLWALPVQIITQNVMVTYKWLMVSSMFVGAMGVWLICKKLTLPGIGLIAGVSYVLQPFLNRSLLLSGMVAQAPVYALSPWLVYFTLEYISTPKGDKKNWLGVSLTTAALILSHAMHAYMVVMCLSIVLVMCTFLHINRGEKIIGWLWAIVFAGGLTAFWSIPGVTGLETPGVPQLLTEAARIYTATVDWFILHTNGGSWFYFSVSLLLISVLAVMPFRKKQFSTINQKQLNIDKLAWALFLSFVFSIWLSFGETWYIYSYIPMHNSLVPGRILSYSSLIGSLLLALVLYKIWFHFKGKIIVQLLLILFITIGVFYDERPLPDLYKNTDYSQIQKDIPLNSTGKDFNTGRFTWFWRSGSEISFFPYINHIMMADGWNIEGTPHNQTLWNHIIAIPAGCTDYVVRNLIQWNVRSLIVSNQYSDLQNTLEQHGFIVYKREGDRTSYISSIPSCYIMKPVRNTLVIGRSADGMAMTFPWMIEGSLIDIEDYSMNFLKHFKVIYLSEPGVRNLTNFENIVKSLIDSGVTVIIEPERVDPPAYFGVTPYAQTNVRISSLITRPENGLQISPFKLTGVPDQAPFIGGLDGILMETDNIGEKGPVVGYKNLGQGKVYFVGLNLSEQLESTWIKNRGMDTKAPNGEAVRLAIEKILDLGNPYKDINPIKLATSPISLRSDGFSFKYDSQSPQPAWISVTYTPRWRVTIDGKEHTIYNQENLILIDLPAGKHTVNFRYGITWVGIIGIIITGMTMICMVLVIINPRWLVRLQASLVKKAQNTVNELFFQ